MFTKLKADIGFSDVEDFCREFTEGVRVEYKRQIEHIPKIVSSFANTLGGIFIIGVETDSTNQVKFPIDGVPKTSGIEEQIMQSALTGIYPEVMPEVMIYEVSTNPDNVVVVVRVEESVRAPHAIQNSTRVYVRVTSVTQPYDLKQAEIDQIKYMLKRREDSQVVTRQILERTEERVESLSRTDEPNLTVIARPVFPYRPIISTADIYGFAVSQLRLTNSRKVVGGICSTTGSPWESKKNDWCYYWELNEHGVVYHRVTIEKSIRTGSGWEIKPNHSDEPYCLNFSHFVSTIGQLIRKAQSFYERCEYSGNIEVTVQLRQVFGKKLLFNPDASLSSDDQHCADSEVLASTQFLLRDLAEKEKFIDVVNELAGQLLWAFNINVAHEVSRDRVKNILKENGVLQAN